VQRSPKHFHVVDDPAKLVEHRVVESVESVDEPVHQFIEQSVEPIVAVVVVIDGLVRSIEPQLVVGRSVEFIGRR
jgi:hypothetical protein